MKQPQVLECAGDTEPVDAARIQVGDLAASPQHPAAAGRGDAGDQVEEGGLAGSVWPEQAKDLAGLNGQLDGVEGLEPAEANPQILKLQQRWCHRGPGSRASVGSPPPGALRSPWSDRPNP